MRIKIVTIKQIKDYYKHRTHEAVLRTSDPDHADYESIRATLIRRTPSSQDKIVAAFDAANGKAKTHTYKPADLWRLVDSAEADLELSGVTQKNRSGARFVYTSAAPSARRYQYSADCTEVEITRGSSAWYLTRVKRISRRPGPGYQERVQRHISEAARDDIVRDALDGFTVQRDQSNAPTPTQIDVVVIDQEASHVN